MKSAMSCLVLAVLSIGCYVGSASACPVAIKSVDIPAVAAPAIAAQAPVVVESVSTITALPIQTVTVLATPTIVTEVAKVKARGSLRRRVRVSACK
jgi:hypothetical protein